MSDTKNIGIRNNEFSNKLKELVEKYKDKDHTLSIPKQCKAMDIPYTSFMKYYNGTAECGFENLIKIAEYYKVSTDYLLGLTESESRDTSAAGAAELLGLSDSAIEKLTELKQLNDINNHSDVFSALMEGINLTMLLDVYVIFIGYICEKISNPDFTGLESYKVNQINYLFNIKDVLSIQIQQVIQDSLYKVCLTYLQSQFIKQGKNNVYIEKYVDLIKKLDNKEISYEQYKDAVKSISQGNTGNN